MPTLQSTYAVQVKNNTRIFFHFLLLSGAGWLCDFATFTALVKFFHTPAFLANFISSFVGVTFVWFTSLGTVFEHSGSARGRFLFIYWGFQLISILGYSQCLHLAQALLDGWGLTALMHIESAVAAKIFVTPFNLLTNFMFMRFLTRLMKIAKTH
jgi:putative flippase GtrA